MSTDTALPEAGPSRGLPAGTAQGRGGRVPRSPARTGRANGVPNTGPVGPALWAHGSASPRRTEPRPLLAHRRVSLEVGTS